MLLGEVLACGVPMRLHWSPRLHSETLCVASAWPWLGSRVSLPAGIQGSGGHQGHLFSPEVSWF